MSIIQLAVTSKVLYALGNDGTIYSAELHEDGTIAAWIQRPTPAPGAAFTIAPVPQTVS